MAALFGLPGAFSSPIGQRIEKATESVQLSEDWMLILEICDMINESDEGPKDAIKAIRKRLTGSSKNSKCMLYTLTVLEAAVKNCGVRFHKQIASKEFLSDLTKLLGGQKNQNAVSQDVQDKILSLVQLWSDAFSNAPEMQQVRTCYETLKSQGYEFPAQNLDTLSPIYTPKKNESLTVNSSKTAHQVHPSRPSSTKTRTLPLSNNRPQTAPAGRVLPQTAAPAPVCVTPEQMSKLRKELDIVERNVKIFNEMLSELSPGREDPDDYQLLVELNKTCREMQKRILLLVNSITNEEVTGVLLRINDDLNNTFIRYDRYEKNRKVITASENEATRSKVSQVSSKEDNVPTNCRESSLIDFNTTPSNSAQKALEDEEFDMFAQSRSSTFADSRQFGSTYEDNINDAATQQSIAGALAAKGLYQPIQSTALISQPRINPFASPVAQPPGKEIDEEIEDVEEWLKRTDLSQIQAQESANRAAILKTNTASHKEESANDSMSKSEFDKFLNSRAQAGNSERHKTLPARPMGDLAGEAHNDDRFGL